MEWKKYNLWGWFIADDHVVESNLVTTYSTNGKKLLKWWKFCLMLHEGRKEIPYNLVAECSNCLLFVSER